MAVNKDYEWVDDTKFLEVVGDRWTRQQIDDALKCPVQTDKGCLERLVPDLLPGSLSAQQIQMRFAPPKNAALIPWRLCQPLPVDLRAAVKILAPRWLRRRDRDGPVCRSVQECHHLRESDRVPS